VQERTNLELTLTEIKSQLQKLHDYKSKAPNEADGILLKECPRYWTDAPLDNFQNSINEG